MTFFGFSRFGKFLVAMLFLDVVGLVLGGLVAPRDPLAQTIVFGVLLTLAPVVAYWLVYRGGLDRLRGD